MITCIATSPVSALQLPEHSAALSFPLTFFDTYSLEVNTAQQTQNPIRTDNLNTDKKVQFVDFAETSG